MADTFKWKPGDPIIELPANAEVEKALRALAEEVEKRATGRLTRDERLLSPEVVDDIFDELCRWFIYNWWPMKLATITQRFGRRVKGFRVIDSLEADPRFEIYTNFNGGRMVMPKAEFKRYCMTLSEKSGGKRTPAQIRLDYMGINKLMQRLDEPTEL